MIATFVIIIASLFSLLIGAWAIMSVIGWVQGLFQTYKIEKVTLLQKITQIIITPCLIALNTLLAFSFLLFGLFGMYLASVELDLNLSMTLVFLAVFGVALVISSTANLIEIKRESGVVVDSSGINFKRLYSGPHAIKPSRIHMKMQSSLHFSKKEIVKVEFVKSRQKLYEILFDPASQRDLIIVQTKAGKYFAKYVPLYNALLIERDLKKIYK